MKRDVKSWVLVGVQLACLAFLLVTGPWFAPPQWIWLELIGFYLGAWALTSMRLRWLRIGPQVARDARLVTRGPYRFIRHPMYAAVLLIALALLISKFNMARALAFALLLGVLLVKLNYEETLLARHFSEYAAYRKRTKRLIPFVY
jgi:protein-S-isoprenylcysteine O-methyltransferase Ste14